MEYDSAIKLKAEANSFLLKQISWTLEMIVLSEGSLGRWESSETLGRHCGQIKSSVQGIASRKQKQIHRLKEETAFKGERWTGRTGKEAGFHIHAVICGK